MVGDLLDNSNGESKSKTNTFGSRDSLLLEDLDHDEDRPSAKKAKRSNTSRKSLSSSFAAIAGDVSSIVNMSEMDGELMTSRKAASRLSSKSSEKLFTDSPVAVSSNSSSKTMHEDSNKQDSSISNNLNASGFSTAVADEFMKPPAPVEGVKRRSRHQFTSDSLLSLG